MKVVLDNNEALCWTCQNTSYQKCEFMQSGGSIVPDYVTKVIKKKLAGIEEKRTVVRACNNYNPDPQYVRICKYCGEQYVIQSIHTDKIDGGYCYDCHIRRKKTYKKPQPWVKQPKVVKSKKCEYCGKEFAPIANNQRYCNEECKLAAKARRDRKIAKNRTTRKNNESARKKWEFDNEKKRLEMQQENLLKEIHKKHREDVAEVKRLYMSQKEEFKAKAKQYYEALDLELAKSLDRLDKTLEDTLVDVNRQLKEAIQEAKNKIYKKETNNNGKDNNNLNT